MYRFRNRRRSGMRTLSTLGCALLLLSAFVRSDSSGRVDPTATAAQDDRRMAITIDDLPVAAGGLHTLARQGEITERLLAVLDEHDVPAIGFVNESKLEENGAVDPRRVELLERWIEAGLELGNHGYAHLDLHRDEPERWMADVLRGERVTRALVESRGRELRWFRHPYLHTGRSAEVRRRTAGFLEEHGYRITPVTIDNGEWIYGKAYAHAWRPVHGHTGPRHHLAPPLGDHRGRGPRGLRGEPTVPAWVEDL